MTKCLACGGTYATTLTDGTRYFHACPPLSDAEVCAALGAPTDASTWTAKQKGDIAAASRVRPNARNENAPDPAAQATILAPFVKPGAAVDWKKANAALDVAVAAPGAGTTTVP